MKCAKQHGFSLVEMMIGTFVLAILGVGVAGMQGSVESTIGTDVVRLDAGSRAARALDKLSRQMRAVSVATLQTLPTGYQSWQACAQGVAMDDLQFRSFDFDPEAADQLASLSDTIELRVEASEDDPINGADDDHDGVVDGKNLVLARPDAMPEVLVSNMTACSFELNERVLELRVTVTLRAPNGHLLAETASIGVELRND